MERTARRALLRASLELSQEFLDEAIHLIAGGHSRGALSRLHLATHHLVLAMLATEGFQPRDHDAATTLLNLFFVRTGRVSVRHARLHGKLHRLAHEADHIPGAVFSPEEISSARVEVEGLLDAASEELRRSGWLAPGSLRVL